jgi:lipoyl(octanoyl) transferase
LRSFGRVCRLPTTVALPLPSPSDDEDIASRDQTGRLTLGRNVTRMDFVDVGYAPSPVEYTRGWALQREVHAAVAAGNRPDTVLLLEHEAVYTAGKRTEPHERPIDGTPVVDVDRGGKITWHGPGQLVGYPVVRLPDPIDVVAYVRRLEQVLVDTVAELGVQAGRVEGRSGVWVPADARGRERKIAAIGIRVAGGVTMHGFALNCDCDLGAFERIVPCGIPDADVTSLTAETGHVVTVADALPVVRAHLAATLVERDHAELSGLSGR